MSQTKELKLTPTEKRVLTLIAEGLSSSEAAEELMIGKRTVDFHLNNIYRRFEVKNRVKAVRVAKRAGLLEEVA